MRRPDNAYPWRPAPLAWFSLSLLAAAAATAAIRPAWWPWALGAVAIATGVTLVALSLKLRKHNVA